MKTFAVLGDVHGNLPALFAVLQDAKQQGAQHFISAGDMIGDGPNPKEVLTALQEVQAICVRGNREQQLVDYWQGKLPSWDQSCQWQTMCWSAKQVGEEGKAFFNQLPSALVLHEENFAIRVCHATPHSMTEIVRPWETDKIIQMLSSIQENILITAHNHIPWIVEYEGKTSINCGSVGLSHRGKSFCAEYVILRIDQGKAHVEMREVLYKGKDILAQYIAKGLWDNGDIWVKAAYREMQTGQRYLAGFIRHLWAIAGVNQLPRGSTVSDELWQTASETWDWKPLFVSEDNHKNCTS